MRRNNATIFFDSTEASLASIKRYINFVIIRLDQIILDVACPYLNYLSSKGELSGFKIAYKLPRSQRGNAQLDREVLANGDFLFLGQNEVDQVTFKHKKVFPVDLDSELIEKWENSVLEFILTAVTASPKLPSDCKVSKHVARVSIPLSELLSPPFRISRDCTMLGGDFRGRLSFSIELGSRNMRVSELLTDMRKTQLDSTFIINEREPGRRTRSRSSSRCMSHLDNNENYDQSEDATYAQKQQVRSRPQSSYSLTDYSNHYVPHNQNHVPLRIDYLPQRENIRKRFTTDEITGDNDSVFTENDDFTKKSEVKTGALQLELTLHSALNLPLVHAKNGRWIPPMAFIQILGRDEQIMSSIAPASCNPIWNWTGKFVISSERGNVLIKVLHKCDEQIKPIGIVTLSSPLKSFEEKDFEISLISPNASGAAIIKLSLDVKAFSRVSKLHSVREQNILTRNLYSPMSSNKSEVEISIRNRPESPPASYAYRRPRSITPPLCLRPLSSDALRAKLQDDVEELLNAVNKLGR